MYTKYSGHQTAYQKGCQDKPVYTNFNTVLQDADRYNEEIALVENPMVPYVCRFPEEHVESSLVYHKGHDRFLSGPQSEIYLKESRKRARQHMSRSPGIPTLTIAYLVVTLWLRAQ